MAFSGDRAVSTEPGDSIRSLSAHAGDDSLITTSSVRRDGSVVGCSVCVVFLEGGVASMVMTSFVRRRGYDEKGTTGKFACGVDGATRDSSDEASAFAKGGEVAFNASLLHIIGSCGSKDRARESRVARSTLLLPPICSGEVARARLGALIALIAVVKPASTPVTRIPCMVVARSKNEDPDRNSGCVSAVVIEMQLDVSGVVPVLMV